MNKFILSVAGIFAVIGGTTALLMPGSIPTDNTASVDVDTSSDAVQFVDDSSDNSSETAPVFVKGSERELKVAVPSSSATQESIYSMMLNSVDYYTKASGTVIIGDHDLSIPLCTTFQTDLLTRNVYVHEHHYDSIQDPYNINSDTLLSEHCVYSKEKYLENRKSTLINNIDKTYSVGIDASQEPSDVIIPDSERFKPGSNGINSAYYRPDPTNVPLASRSLFPQGFTMGALHDFDLWQINDITELDGHECFFITGNPDESYANKTGISYYEMYVDTSTGTVIRLQGFNADGTLNCYVYTDDLRFDDEAEEPASAPEECPEGYSTIR